MQEPPSEGYEQMANGQDRTKLASDSNKQSPIEQNAAEFKVNDLIGGDYQVLRWIGAGGMGNVYCVRHTIMQTEYALKTLSADKVTEIAWRRFQNEAQAIARMNHPNIVGIYNLGLHEGRLPFYVMDLLKGDTLLDILRSRGPMEWTEALPLFIELCAGFGYAHKKGIVHRDIKPPNIVLMDSPEPACRVKIVDFGIAKLSGIKDPQNQYLTNVGEVCGSPYYMSPEQTEGKRIDARSDIYSLGCTLFEMLTGSPPIRGRSAMDTMLMHQTTAPPTLKTASGGKEFPEMLEQIMGTLLAKAPMDRYQTMELVRDDLSTIMTGQQSAINPYITQSAKKLKPVDFGEDETKSRAKSKLPPRQYQSKSEEETDYEEGPASENRPNIATIGAIGATVLACALVCGGLYFVFFQPQSTKAKLPPPVSLKDQPVYFADDMDEMASKISSTDRIFVRKDRNSKIPTTSINQTFPFSQIKKLDGRPMKVFDFPEDITIGDIEGRSDTVPARGTIRFRLNEKLTFQPDPILVKYPAYVARFRPKDVEKIALNGPDVTDAMLQLSCSIPGATILEVDDCPNISIKGMEAINNMQSLLTLKLDHPLKDLSSLAHLGKLQELQTVTFINQKDKDMQTLLAAVKNSFKLRKLGLFRDTVTDRDFAIIAAMPALKVLYLDDSQFTPEALLNLRNSKSIETLSLINYHLNDALLRTLKSLKTLKLVVLTLPASDEKRYSRVQAELAPIKVKRNLDRTDAVPSNFALDPI